jgi:dihydropteroate synthase
MTTPPSPLNRALYTIPLAHGGVLDVGSRPLIMGVLNVTPDSFADAGRFSDPSQAVAAALEIEAGGADLIDIGGESTRPGAVPVDAASEIARVVPVVEALRGRLRIPVSVDTYKARVADAALDAGAAMINDISGLQYEPAMAAVVARQGAALVLMHTRGRSADMYGRADYQDLIGEVVAELKSSIRRATAAGVPMDAILVDPGVGFAKRPDDSYGVLARLPEIARALGRPVLVGPSRKSFLKEAAGGADGPQRDWPTAAAVAAAVLGGAHIVRVHAVPQMVQAVKAAEEIRRRLPAAPDQLR